MTRLPAIAVILLALAGLVLVDRGADTTESAVSAPGTPAAVTAEPARHQAGSTWYCAAGIITPDSRNDHLVTITNLTDTPLRGMLTIYPALSNTAGNSIPFGRGSQTLELPADDQIVVSLAPVVAASDAQLAIETGAFVAALVEFESGQVHVAHSVVSPLGADTAPCSTQSSPTWWFASGTTTDAVTYQVHLFNPFPDDAVVDITFVTDEGVREPNIFKGRLVPAHSVSVVDITPVVTVRQQVTAAITTRTGRIIAERLQLFGNEAGPIGVSLSAGTPELGEQWFFPGGGSQSGVGESYVIYNPTDEPAEVEFEIKPDSADRAGDIAPVPVPVGPNERWVVNTSVHPTHPGDIVALVDAVGIVGSGERYFVSVRSFNGVPIAVERVLTRAGEPGRGVASGFGINRAATEQTLTLPGWLFAGADGTETPPRGELAVLNPNGNTIARVDVWVGGPNNPPGQDPDHTVELAPRRRAAFDLDALVGPGDRWIRIESSAGVMTELVANDANRLAISTGTTTGGVEMVPDLYAFE